MLVALSCLCVMLSATTTSPAAAHQSRFHSTCSAQDGCALAAAIAHASDSEAEELEEEPQEGAEEAATAEVEAEETEAEDTSPTTGSASANPVAVSHLKLTERATSALARRLPSASAVAFSFTLSAGADVRVTIARQTGSGEYKHWTKLPDSLTLSLAQGHLARSLKGHNRLSVGRYRLTLKPTGGRPRSIYLSVQA